MRAIFETVDELAELIQNAADRVAEAFGEGNISQEPHFTDRMLGRIDGVVDNYKADGVVWRARTLTDRGRGAEESIFGADFAGVFHADAPDLFVTKGFLAQAKCLAQGAVMKAGELERLKRQCSVMLRHTPDAYVFLYGLEGVRVVSALAVQGCSSGELDNLGTKSVAEFYKDHFRCFIGDDRIRTANADGLWDLEQYGRQRLLYITAVELT